MKKYQCESIAKIQCCATVLETFSLSSSSQCNITSDNTTISTFEQV